MVIGSSRYTIDGLSSIDGLSMVLSFLHDLFMAVVDDREHALAHCIESTVSCRQDVPDLVLDVNHCPGLTPFVVVGCTLHLRPDVRYGLHLPGYVRDTPT